MSFHRWLQNLRSALATGRGQRHDRRRGSLRAARHRPKLEVLEDRSLLSFSPAVTYAAGMSPAAVVTADFNGARPARRGNGLFMVSQTRSQKEKHHLESSFQIWASFKE